jgi:hypothetical protein
MRFGDFDHFIWWPGWWTRFCRRGVRSTSATVDLGGVAGDYMGPSEIMAVLQSFRTI